MYVSESTLDELLQRVYRKLLKNRCNIKVSKGKIKYEIFGALLHLENPLARISLTETKGKAFSPLGELLWYLSGSNKLSFIKYYIPIYSEFSDNNRTIHGAYGTRFMKMHGKVNQIENVIDLLRTKPSSRRAVIQLFDAKDLIGSHKDIPCTNSLQFLIRENKLNLLASLRSNDAFKGLTHDIFCFTMIQEIIARTLKIEVGSYYHSVGSLHLYEEDIKRVSKYLKEGYQSTKFEMPPMPVSNPWGNIQDIIKIENKIRKNEDIEIADFNFEPYWNDIVLLLRIFKLLKKKDYEKIKIVSEKITFERYKLYIKEKIFRKLPNIYLNG